MGEDYVIRSGRGPNEQPFPTPELNVGNIVKLKQPYFGEPPPDGHSYQWGVIVEHVSRNFAGVPKVCLHVYDDAGALLLNSETMIPEFIDFVASDLILWKIANEIGYDPVCPDGFDLYPDCRMCGGNRDQDIVGDDRCRDCGGWGFVSAMRRLPPRPPEWRKPA